MQSIASVLVIPRGSRTVPPGRSKNWKEAIRPLHQALAEVGIGKSFTTWHGLWTLLHATSPPPVCSWQTLVGQFTLHDLIIKIRSRTAGRSAALMAWNIRWLVDPNTKAAAKKRAVVVAATLAHHIVCLSETHWLECDASLWKQLFPTCDVRHAPATHAPGGRPKGGVAVVIPARFEVLSERIVIPGCVLAVEVQERGTHAAFTIYSVYLPPGARRAEVATLLSELPPPTGTCFAAGDFNYDIEKSQG